MLSSELFPRVCGLNAVSEHSVCYIFKGEYLLAYEVGTDRLFQNVGI
jgi:hypothetical protein